METRIFALRDVKGDAFGSLILSTKAGLAIRGLVESLRQQGGPVRDYPEDYSLFELGTYNYVSGLLTSHPAPVFICSALEAISQIKASRVTDPLVTAPSVEAVQ